MTIEDRRHMDELVTRRHAIERVAEDLGLKREGKHFYCPACHPGADCKPDLVIKDGRFQCFRCGALGDVVGLVKLARQCDLESALEWLSREIR
ncbi:CHC2 zinc finger domain-containing protein [Geoalkalibacter sp.]|uniref:CHC2 zinc finger domain-containing protein n=1 Tax=Geoalkalibacter sp. TaxID=3041440 RepID=UPI00272E8E22|nr:CHC2 zinc finger domain-containing protein [Geoalkalibacter sp.]